MMAIGALVFDAYGTLYDVQSVRSLLVDRCGDKGEIITQLWRLKQLEYTWLRTLMGCYEDFWCVTRAALEFALTGVGIAPTSSLCDELMDAYLHLDLYAEAPQALESLRDYKLAILSNGSPRMLEALVGSAGIAERFTAVVSCDQVQRYKPEPACYALVEPALQMSKQQILFISSNGFDVAGAKRYGFQVAWIERMGDVPPPQDSQVGPATFYRLMRGRGEQLGYQPDFHLKRLTELAAVLSA
jgi:2-haloacid dehalogenase